jgi:alanyl-tRNA synthetase
MSKTPIASRTASQLRHEFVDFFTVRGHTAVPSAPMAPLGDKTLLFTTAGMVQFKPYYTATGELPYTRAVSVQKCLRLSDLDSVGQTPRHDTFFEMLGNFSFGDYFKAEAIEWAWEFCTRTLGLPPDPLHVSVFNGEGGLPVDDEARELWRQTGLAEDHIVGLGRADNFWGPAGGTGPCGPSSEIYYDLGAEACTCDGSCSAGSDCDRFMEFWNLVFPQYDAQPDGELVPLPKPGIDTGMGLERLALILQDKRSIFETDLFLPVVDLLAGKAGLSGLPRLGHPDDPKAVALAIVADHTRALTFALGEGLSPGNEGRGYVLRRLLRRAARQGRILGLHDPFLEEAAETVIGSFESDYPELRASERRIRTVLQREEEAFLRTFEQGQDRFEGLVKEAQSRGSKTLEGEAVFQLHDTYGFLVDLTEEMAHERGLEIDRDGFEKAMEEQRVRARGASKFESGAAVSTADGPTWEIVSEGEDSEFVGWETLSAVSPVRRWRLCPDMGGDVAEMVLETTPCYPEGGGQVADTGHLTGDGFEADVMDVRRADLQSPIIHRIRIRKGSLPVEEVRIEVDADGRAGTMRNHTATHLLHAALRRVLGTHVQQAGSVVAPDRLRFDYTHFEAPTPEQIKAVEDDVNRAVLANIEVSVIWSSMEEALADGVIAFFGEKYPSRVRSVRVPGVSAELCGGTHCIRTGDIGLFKILSDSSIAAGTRRVEAATGLNLIDRLRQLETSAGSVGKLLNVRAEDIPQRVQGLLKEVHDLKTKRAKSGSGEIGNEIEALRSALRESPRGKFVAGEVSAEDAKSLREAGDRVSGLVEPGVGIIWTKIEDRYAGQIVVSKSVAKNGITARTVAAGLSKRLGVRGGGKDTSAQVGGKIDKQIAEIIEESWKLLASIMEDAK